MVQMSTLLVISVKVSILLVACVYYVADDMTVLLCVVQIQ